MKLIATTQHFRIFSLIKKYDIEKLSFLLTEFFHQTFLVELLSSDEWSYYQCDLNVSVPIVYEIDANLESGFLDIDDVSIIDRECYQQYFQIQVSNKT